MESTDPVEHRLLFLGRLKPRDSSVGSLTSSLLAMLLSVQRLGHLSFVLNPTSLETFPEPQKGLSDMSRIFGRFCSSSWIGNSGLALMLSLSAFLPSGAHQGVGC